MYRHSIIIAVLVSQIIAGAPPPLISFGEDGRLGVNFGGYHAGVGIGKNGGLFAEAGTPLGQAAKAGLGGSVDGGPAGGLYAGATAGGNVKAEAGLSGSVDGDKSSGRGFANAQAGDRFASKTLEGSSQGNGVVVTKTKTYTPKEVVIVDRTNAQPPVEPVEINRPSYKKVHKEFRLQNTNEVNANEQTPELPSPPAPVFKEVSNPWMESRVDYRNNYDLPFNLGGFFDSLFRIPQPEYVPTPWWIPNERYYTNEVVYRPVVVEKIRRTKPRHHYRKIAYINSDEYALNNPGPVIQKRIDLAPERVADVQSNSGAVVYKEFQRSPTFFSDIFNIPIQTLKAVSGLLSNTASGTKVSVEKSFQTETSKHSEPSLKSAHSHVSVQTPTATKLVDDIFAIPINTLDAVNKFLVNNVPARKRVVVEKNNGQEPEEVQQLRVRPGKKWKTKRVTYEHADQPSSSNPEVTKEKSNAEQ